MTDWKGVVENPGADTGKRPASGGSWKGQPERHIGAPSKDGSDPSGGDGAEKSRTPVEK